MPRSRLTDLQHRVLATLAGMQPPWTLTGGGALAGVYLGHRTTRDLDLFWHGAESLASLRDDVEQRLTASGVRVETLQNAPAFRQLRVSDGEAAIVVDLVADRVPTIESPVQMQVGEHSIFVDTPHEILVNKLCALLGRAEARDLLDVRELLRSGLDLERALLDAPRKDTGFSPLTLSWVLRQPSMSSALSVAVLDDSSSAELLAFRDELVQQVMEAAAPDP